MFSNFVIPCIVSSIVSIFLIWFMKKFVINVDERLEKLEKEVFNNESESNW